MRATAIEIEWHSGLPIFASESFLKAVGDEYGWLGGTDDSGKLRCILPYTVIRKAIFRMVRFQVETIPLGEELGVQEEKAFLNSAIEYFRSIGADIIIPATTNTIFRTYPDGADAAPYGSYVIDLCQPENILWRNVGKITRQNIGTAQRNGVSIRSGIGELAEAYKLIVDTFKRSKLPFMSYEAFKRYVLGLGENGKLLIADYQNVAHSCTVYAFSNYCAYAVYGGNIAEVHQGAMKLVQWEAIRMFQKLGVQRFDFVGARINPEKGSKQEAINSFKQRFGAKHIQGYMWKYPLRPVGSLAYSLAVRFFREGDIVDNERHKMENSTDLATESQSGGTGKGDS
jgi:hypothetical protein